jgi:hypothetical protein
MIEIKAPHDGSPVQIYENEFRDFCVAIHKLNTQWWLNPDGTYKERNIGEMLMLTTSELAEAMEGDRKNLMDDHLPKYRQYPVELVDAMIRLADQLGAYFAKHPDHDPGRILADKCAYNANRADHRPENRAKEGGKKY